MNALIEIDNAIAALVAYRAKCERSGRERQDSHEYLDVLKAFDKIEGKDALVDAISDAEYDLEPCDGCGRVTYCSCDHAYEDKVAWGMEARFNGDGSVGVTL